MQLGAGSGGATLEDLLDKVDASTRAVELIAQQLVGGAGRGAETAMHAGAQDRVRLPALGRILNKVG